MPFTGNGRLHLEKWKLDIPDGTVTPPSAPLGTNKFIISTSSGGIYLGEISNRKFKSRKILQLNNSQIRDIKTLNNKVFISSIVNNKNNCPAIRIYQANLDDNKNPLKKIETIWESNTDCSKSGLSSREPGGKFLVIDDTRLLISFGGGTAKIDNQIANDFGKTILLTFTNDKVTSKQIFSSGHRNPSGLFLHQKEPLEVYEVEHGPMGGDELNLLKFGNNYGWPYVSYGMPYGENNAPKTEPSTISTSFLNHKGYSEPLFSWIPDIGISDVVEIKSKKEFPFWFGDILVGSLNGSYQSGHSIYRLHLVDGKVNLLERIDLDEKIRSIFEDDSGNIYFKTDSQKIGRITSQANK
jgi:glucose/arabinose dehydrogenase